MATPTNYSLKYPDEDEFCKSGPCGTGDCLGKMYFNTRPQNFCDDVTLQKDCTIVGNVTVTPAEITVGDITYAETVIVDLFGRSFYVLAAAAPYPGPLPP
jgi:hypothetical protein